MTGSLALEDGEKTHNLCQQRFEWHRATLAKAGLYLLRSGFRVASAIGMRLLFGTLIAALTLIVSACGGSMKTVTVTRTITVPARSSQSGVVPSCSAFTNVSALARLAAADFGVLPVPVVPRGKRAVNSAVVYKQFPPAGITVSRRLLTIYVRTNHAKSGTAVVLDPATGAVTHAVCPRLRSRLGHVAA